MAHPATSSRVMSPGWSASSAEGQSVYNANAAGRVCNAEMSAAQGPWRHAQDGYNGCHSGATGGLRADRREGGGRQ
jgi:hypothetical protein